MAAWDNDPIVGDAKPWAADPIVADVGVADRARAGVGGVNRGIAAIAGLPVDTAENVINLGKAGFGSVMTALGRSDLAPELTSGSFLGSQHIAQLMERFGIRASNPNPQDVPSQMLYRAGTIAPGVAFNAGGINSYRDMLNPLVQTVLSATGGAVGEQVAGPNGAMLGALAPAAASAAYSAARAPSLEQRRINNVEQDRIAANARAEGMTIPPVQTNPGNIVNQVTQGMGSGKARTEMVASSMNQPRINDIAKTDVGLPPTTPLTAQALEAIRQTAGNAYQAVKDWGAQFNLRIRPDARYNADLRSLGGDFNAIATRFPEIAKNEGIDTIRASLFNQNISPMEAIELTKKLRFDASKNLKAFDDPAKAALGQAQRGAANAIENLLERTLSRSGQQNLLDDFRNARRQIAISHDIESALVGGNVNPQALAAIIKKGDYLSGGLRNVAEAARVYQGAFRPPNPANAQEFSMWDTFAGGAGAMGLSAGYGTGNTPITATAAAALAVPAARYAVRHGILSGPYQNTLGTPDYSPAVRPDSALSVFMRGNMAGQK